VYLLVEILSPFLAALGVILATSAPRGEKLGLLIAAGVAAFPGLWLLIEGAN
jgi:hypothetical protein